MPRMTESRAARIKLPQDGQTFAWCSEVKGFGVRCTATTRSYIVQPRHNGQKLRINLGTVAVMPFEGPPNSPGARDLAITALAAARRGEDPRKAIGQRKQPEGVTLGDVWQAYCEAGHPKLKGTARKRPTTIKKDCHRYRFHLARQLGPIPIAHIDTACVRRWLDKIPTEGSRSHALAQLKSLLSFSTTRGFATAHRIDIACSPSRKVANYFKPAELVKLDKALVGLIRDNTDRILPFTILRVLLATGARPIEIMSLRWADLDLAEQVIRLERHKGDEHSGKDILLPPAAVAALKVVPKTSSPFVFFTPRSESGHVTKLEVAWADALKAAGLRKVRLYDLRHSFASALVGEGASLYVAGKLLGHVNATTTQRYAHLERSVARTALDKVAAVLGGPRR
jgi:integrase